jgi:hypothetical protein
LVKLDFIGGVQVEDLTETVVEGIAVKAASGSEFGSGPDDAGHDHGDDQIALSAWSGVEDVLQVKVTQTTQDGGNMAMRQGARDVEGVGQRGRGGSQRAGQGQAERFNLPRGEMSDVGDGASLDFAFKTIGFAEEDGGRGVAVRYGGNVHAYIIINHACNCKHKYQNTCLHFTAKKRPTSIKTKRFPNLAVRTSA